MLKLPDFGAMALVLGPGPFRVYTIGNAISLVGTWMQRISVGYLTWEMTHSATWLGLMAFADLFPAVVISPFAGVVADRWSRFRLLRLMQVLGLVQAVALTILHASGILTVHLLLAMTLALGIVVSFAMPARLAMISAMVPRDLLRHAIAVNAISFNLARFLGPAASGLLISTVGVTWAIAANAASYIAVIAALAMMPPAVRRDPARSESRFGSDMKEGLLYVFRDRGTAALLVLMIVTGLGTRPLVELLPGFAGGVFDAGAQGLATLTAAIGIGAIAGGLWSAGRAQGRAISRALVLSSLAAAACVIAFCTIGDLWLATPVLCAVGFCWVSAGISAQSLLQLGTDDRLRGRVMALYGVILRASPAIGALGMGLVADLVGLQLTVAASAGLVIAFLALTQLRSSTISDRFDNVNIGDTRRSDG